MRAIPSLCALTLLAPPSFAGQASSRLVDTWWTGDPNCYITDIAFTARGQASIFYQDGRNDGGSWTLAGTTLTIRFERYDDTFTGRYSGAVIRATHVWRDETRMRHTDECVFTELHGTGI
jgi:hypothetical protein